MKKRIGIIGGAGPMASCLLYKKMILEYLLTYSCKNEEVPEIILVSYPFSPMNTVSQSTENNLTIQAELQHCIDLLKAADVEIMTIACNTLHSFLGALSLGTIRCLHMPKTVLSYAQEQGLKKLLLLSTPTTAKTEIYHDPNIKIIYPPPSDQEKIAHIISHLLEGKVEKKDTKLLEKITHQNYKREKFDGVILGCTELPILHDVYPVKPQLPIAVLDSLDITAHEMAKHTHQIPAEIFTKQPRLFCSTTQ